MFLLHMLFKLFDKIMEKLINDVEKKLISDETCSQIFKEKNQEETLKLLKKHKEMLNKNNNKINDYFNSIKDNSDEKFKKWNDFKEKNLFDVEIILPIKIPKIKFIIIKNDFINNIVNKIKFFNEKIKREEKTTNAVDVITQLYVVSLNNNSNKVTFAYWLKEILNDWKVQTSAIEVFKKIKEDILKDYGIKENLNNLLRKSNWCYLMFMLHTVFELYKKVLKIIVEKVEIKKNICNYIDKKDEECDEFIKKLNEMVIENDKKINEFFELNKDIFNDKEILIKWKGFIEKNLFDVEIEIKLEENKVEVKEPEEKKEFIRKITEKIRVRGNVHFNPYSFNYSPPQFPTHSPFHLPINHNGIQYNKFEGKYSGQFNDKGYDFSHNARYYHH
ncbi:hypothetical protein Mgra_00004773 [Meloidogyne graminicola]|uniref:Uncharacterized protein n=1 Tax=Meloidogyne graminicola TaxID=189291 RepID=A0A8S9ZR08_9BILA|nr:hypothetical protein Mgra_00004773 [Meloidogyne graminicola]